MLKINEERFYNELKRARSVLLHNPSLSAIKCDYEILQELNDRLNKISNKHYDVSKLFFTKKEEIIPNRYLNNIIFDFLNTIDENEEILKAISNNYSNYLDEIEFVSFPYCKHEKVYDEKSFIDIILSFFSTYGNETYNIVKKYFDEERIQMDFEKEIKESDADFAYLVGAKAGYIFTALKTYTLQVAKVIVHELGHAYDAEKFIFPQQKKLQVLSDYLAEVPSTTFEVAFTDYLIDNNIGDDIGLFLQNEDYYDIEDYFCDTMEVFDIFESKNIIMDDFGIISDNNQNEHDISSDIIYGLGYYIAYHFNYIRKENPKEFNKLFNNFIYRRKDVSLIQLINEMGIDINDFISGKLIQPKIKKENQLLRKKYEHLF